MVTILIIALLIAEPGFAADALRLPLRSAGACEGESCWNKPWASRAHPMHRTLSADMALHVRTAPLRSTIAFTIPAHTPFAVIRHDLYTLITKPIALSKKYISEHCEFDASQSPLLHGGESAYPLYYAGEGAYQMWYRGERFYCVEPRQAEKLFRAQAWLEIDYQGRRGWWGEPAHCRGALHQTHCPTFLPSSEN